VPPLVFEQSFRVVMSEVDVAQIHFTALFRWMDRGLTEWLALAGHPFTRLLEEGPGIPLVDVRATFRERILLDDILVLRTWAAAPGRTSFRTRHRFVRGGSVAAEGEAVHVCVHRATRETVPVPDWLRGLAADDGWTPPQGTEP